MSGSTITTTTSMPSAAGTTAAPATTIDATTASTPVTRGREPIRSSRQSGSSSGGLNRRSRSRSRVRIPSAAGSRLRGVVRSLRRAASGLSSHSSSGGSQRGGVGSKAGGDASSIATSDNISTSLLLNRDPPSLVGGRPVDTVVTTSAEGVMAPPRSTAALELVVLLMDPISRRFELLQLEFDSHRAKVSDLLAQIPMSVTEESLKTQSYVGVMDESAHLREGSVRLLEAFGKGQTHTGNSAASAAASKTSSKMILVAKPKGISAKETMRLAKPILSDKKVATMLTSSGFDIEGWKPPSSHVGKNTKFVNVQDIPDTERVTVGGAVGSLSTPTKTGVESAKSVDIAAVESGGDEDGTKVHNSTTATVLLWLTVVTICFSTIHNFLIVPVAINQVLVPGTFRAKCGLIGYFIPTPVLQGIKNNLWEPVLGTDHTPSFLSCQPEYLSVSSDGTRVTITDANGEVNLVIKDGHVCGTDKKDDASCVDGLVMTEQKTLLMGGRPVKTAIVYYNDDPKDRLRYLSPWPFVEEPIKLKLRPFNRVSRVGLN